MKDTPVILLIEDDRDIIEANRYALELEGFEVHAARTLRQGIRMFRETAPDLIIMEAVLPDGLSFEAGKDFRGERDICIIYLSRLSEKENVLRGLRSGGDDYIVKPYMMEELVLRTKALFRRRWPQIVYRKSFSTGKLVWHLNAKQIGMDGSLLALKPREYAVLEYLARNRASYIMSSEIAESVWLSEHPEEVESSVHNTIYGIRKKIKGSGCEILHKRGRGYRFIVKEE